MAISDFGNRSAYYSQAVDEALDRVRRSDLSIWEKSRIGGRIDSLRRQPEPQPRISFGRMVGTLRDAGYGAGPAYIGSRLLGLPKPLHYAAAGAGATLGAVLGGAMSKHGTYADAEEDAVNAYKLGFVAQARHRRYFDKGAAVVVPVNPADLAAIPSGIAGAGRGFARAAGSVAGSSLSRPRAKQLAELEAEEEMLRERLRQLLESRSDREVSKILASRRS